MATDSGTGPKTPNLIPPLPAWRQEVRARVEAYRENHPRQVKDKRDNATAPERGDAGPAAAGEAAPGPTRVLAFRHQPALMVLTSHGSAEPLAEPIELAAAAAAPEPPVAEESSWASAAASDYLQLPLPMGIAAEPAPAPLPDALAPPRLRFQAGLTDAAVVGVAAVLFALAGWASQNFPAFTSPQLRPLLPALVAVPVALAALYLLLCAYAGGATVGMRCCGLAVTAWDGPLTMAARRRRGWASVVSLAALGLGFAWMVCDRQHLSWHDAISRTCVVVDAERE